MAHLRFLLDRVDDPTGTSGIGTVAEGIEFSDGMVVLRWLSDTPSVVIYSCIEDLIRVHGHQGKTVVRWLDSREGFR